MKRKVFSLFLLLFLSLFTLASCENSSSKSETITRMTVDINPSVEFMVDGDNKVISVTALNDDGSILIVGEAFVGKTPEEAVELMVSLAADTGYLVKGNVEASENEVKISVSGDSKYAEDLLNDVKETAAETLEKLDINGCVEQVKALELAALRKLALSTSLYTEAEIEAMSEQQLYDVIAQGRIETALLLTEEMRKVYYSAKEYEISFAQSEEVSKIIKSMGFIYTAVHTTYNSALELYGSAITELEELRYDLLVSPESDYQKALAKLRDAKVELLEKKTYTASLEINGTEYVEAVASLQLSEEKYNEALARFEELGNQANKAMESIISTLRQAEEALKKLEGTLFDDNIEAKLAEKAVEIEQNINELKNKFFTEFEKAHADDINAIKNSLLEKKQELIASIKGTN